MTLPRLLAPTALALFLGLGSTGCAGLDTHRKVSSRAYSILSTQGADKAEQQANALLAGAQAELNASRREFGEALEAIDDGGEAARALEKMRTAAPGAAVGAPTLSTFVGQATDNSDLLKAAQMVAAETAGIDGEDAEAANTTANDLAAAIQEFERVNVAAKLSRGAAKEIRSALASNAKYIVSAEPFYSVGAVVAFDNDLDATSIPTVAYNFYPFDADWCDTLGMQFLFGGVLSSGAGAGSGGNDDSSIGLALGGGFFLPVGSSGTLSFGHMGWDESDSGQNGWYIGINIGTQSQSTALAQ